MFRRVVYVLVALVMASMGILVAAMPAAAAPATATQHSARRCDPKPHIQTPPALKGQAGSTRKQLSSPCPQGQVPRAVEARRTKSRPPTPASPADNGYFYAGATQNYNTSGASGNFSQPSPNLASGDSHTLAELAMLSGTDTSSSNIIEIGWTVDQSLNGDTAPHLFVSYWVAGTFACYDGCGWVQYSGDLYPGMAVTVTSTPQQYAMYYYQGNWWYYYAGEWIGYFPGSLWAFTNSGVTEYAFTSAARTDWFGEVNTSASVPCSQMGDGVYGSARPYYFLRGYTPPAVINNMYFINGPWASATTFQTSSYYDTGRSTGSSFTYGGPGGSC